MSYFNPEFHQIEVTDAEGIVVTALIALVMGGFEINDAWTTTQFRDDQGRPGIRRAGYKKPFTEDMITQITEQF